MPGLTVIFISWSKYFITAFSGPCGSYECLSKCPERWDGKRMDFVGWDGIVLQLRHGKIYSPISGPDFFGRTVCVYSVWDEECVILTAQESEWPKGLMNVDMQSISLDIVIYNDTAMYLFGQHELMTQCAKYGIPTAVPQTNFGNGSEKAEMKNFLISLCFILLSPCFVLFSRIWSIGHGSLILTIS